MSLLAFEEKTEQKCYFDKSTWQNRHTHIMILVILGKYYYFFYLFLNRHRHLIQDGRSLRPLCLTEQYQASNNVTRHNVQVSEELCKKTGHL